MSVFVDRVIGLFVLLVVVAVAMGAEASLVRAHPELWSSALIVAAAIAGAADPLGNGTTSPYNPATVVALLDGRDRNIASQRYEGADLSLRYRAPIGSQTLTLTASGTWLDSRQRLLPTLPVTDLAGTIFNAPHFRARGGASFGGGWHGATRPRGQWARRVA